jgi:DNA-binding NtrC family response regulator
VKEKATVLLVEDEATVRSVLSGLLSALGYRCIVAANAVDALQIIEANLFRLDLLMTDLKMPGELDGLDVADKVRVFQPEAAILLISAYAESPTMKTAASRGYRVLEKPFRQSQLEAAMAEELEKRRGGEAGAGDERQSSVVSIKAARDKDRLQ